MPQQSKPIPSRLNADNASSAAARYPFALFFLLLLILLVFPIFFTEAPTDTGSRADGSAETGEPAATFSVPVPPPEEPKGDDLILTVNLSTSTVPVVPFSQPATSTVALPAGEPGMSETLYFGSFYNSFSSPARLDLEHSGLHEDFIVSALMFPPDYSWQDSPAAAVSETEKKYFASLNFNDFNPPVDGVDESYHERICLGADCLEQQGNDLLYKGQALSRPEEIKPAAAGSDAVVAVSIAALNKRWLVGFTLKEGGAYRGRVYYFDGRNFSEIIPGGIDSPYFGRLGFGGEEGDFMIVYGAYEGRAYRVRGTKLSDLSGFFSIRLMGGGFQAAILKNGAGDKANWYVYSLSRNRPHLIKLWQNNGPEIQGVVDLGHSLLPYETRSAAFTLRSAGRPKAGDPIVLLAQLKDAAGAEKWHIFQDKGFKNKEAAELVTAPIVHDGNGTRIIIKRIADSHVETGEGGETAVTLWFMPTDEAGSRNQDWREVPFGKDFNFVTPLLDRYLLKLSFVAAPDPFYSPFVASLTFNYYCQKKR